MSFSEAFLGWKVSRRVAEMKQTRILERNAQFVEHCPQFLSKNNFRDGRKCTSMLVRVRVLYTEDVTNIATGNKTCPQCS
jgi:hypothetical protein